MDALFDLDGTVPTEPTPDPSAEPARVSPADAWEPPQEPDPEPWPEDDHGHEPEPADAWVPPAAVPAASSRPAANRPARGASSLVEGLNPPQAEAVLHEGEALLIIAGAGSGKTRVLTHRIAHLLEAGRARPHQILAITFTNKAAGEMRERVAALVGPEARGMWVATFHSACVRILRADHQLAGLSSSFSIYDTADSVNLMKLVMKELNLDPKKFTPKAILGRIGKFKDELIDPEVALAGAAMASKFSIEHAAATAYPLYQRRLEAANAVDFDDIIVKTVRLVQNHPQVARAYRERFRHILVDEYQDTNHAQYVLVRELVGQEGDPSLPPSELTVVGDADQSIYAFRGATIRNILEFEKDYPNAHIVRLEQNYRSTQNILSAANAVIENNSDRRPKNLWTDSGAGEKIAGYAADTEQEEAQYIAKEIRRLIDDEGVAPSDVAIMYRANAQSRAVEERFIRAEIPYKVIGGTRFYERKEIKDMLAYLAAVVNEDDDVATRRIINEPKRGIGDTAVEAVESVRRTLVAAGEQASFGTALRRLDDAGLQARSERAIGEFVRLMDDLRALARDNGPAGVLDAIADRSGLLASLRSSEDPQDASRIENIMELVAVGREFSEENPEGTLADFLEKVALVADADQLPDSAGAGGVVTMMTLHTAKGLEFPVVFLTGMEDGTFPHMRSIESGDPKDMEEERRLAYVGLTRARERLYLTRAEARSSWGAPQYFGASRFVDEIPAELMEWTRSTPSMASLRARSDSGTSRSGAWSGMGYGGNQDREDGNSYARAGAVRTRRVPPSPPGAGGGDVGFEVGERVLHDKFGMGKVVGTEGVGRNAVVKVDFGGDVKRLVLRFNSLEKL
ncbi:DNA helicase PcrA [Demequina sp. SYSU T00039]|uniref:ATP-dependent DNA helicase n=1 Tax=Demequina lignilytica TaxID=3051663 RepID=A0AAW7M3H3_9MICO|nr:MULTISPECIES: DNA helicase PcrA [unclassified Demequina]MDN4478186.1 DNA helicase PcrA [Demequina sp. SYSU T00039-1]MDN4488364.1 DNA helicase PcrA [Demequina sp. SYSU T00039]